MLLAWKEVNGEVPQGMVLEPDFLSMLTPINLESFLNNKALKSVGNRELFKLVRDGEHFWRTVGKPNKTIGSWIIWCQIKLSQDKRMVIHIIRNNLCYWCTLIDFELTTTFQEKGLIVIMNISIKVSIHRARLWERSADVQVKWWEACEKRWKVRVFHFGKKRK